MTKEITEVITEIRELTERIAEMNAKEVDGFIKWCAGSPEFGEIMDGLVKKSLDCAVANN